PDTPELGEDDDEEDEKAEEDWEDRHLLALRHVVVCRILAGDNTHDGIRPCIDACIVIPIPEFRQDVVLDNTFAECIRKHAFDAKACVDEYFSIAFCYQQQDAVAPVLLPDAPLLK